MSSSRLHSPARTASRRLFQLDKEEPQRPSSSGSAARNKLLTPIKRPDSADGKLFQAKVAGRSDDDVAQSKQTQNSSFALSVTSKRSSETKQKPTAEEKLKGIELKLREVREKRKFMEIEKLAKEEEAFEALSGHKKKKPKKKFQLKKIPVKKSNKLEFHHPYVDYIFADVVNSPYMTKPLDHYPKATFTIVEQLRELKRKGIKFSDIPKDKQPYNIDEVRNTFIEEVVKFHANYNVTAVHNEAAALTSSAAANAKASSKLGGKDRPKSLDGSSLPSMSGKSLAEAAAIGGSSRLLRALGQGERPHTSDNMVSRKSFENFFVGNEESEYADDFFDAFEVVEGGEGAKDSPKVSSFAAPEGEANPYADEDFVAEEPNLAEQNAEVVALQAAEIQAALEAQRAAERSLEEEMAKRREEEEQRALVAARAAIPKEPQTPVVAAQPLGILSSKKKEKKVRVKVQFGEDIVHPDSPVAAKADSSLPSVSSLSSTSSVVSMTLAEFEREEMEDERSVVELTASKAINIVVSEVIENLVQVRVLRAQSLLENPVTNLRSQCIHLTNHIIGSSVKKVIMSISKARARDSIIVTKQHMQKTLSADKVDIDETRALSLHAVEAAISASTKAIDIITSTKRKITEPAASASPSKSEVVNSMSAMMVQGHINSSVKGLVTSGSIAKFSASSSGKTSDDADFFGDLELDMSEEVLPDLSVVGVKTAAPPSPKHTAREVDLGAKEEFIYNGDK